MCNFVPGEAIAVGPIDALKELRDGLPGQLGPVRSLLSPGINRVRLDSDLGRLGVVTLRTDPGMELYAVSRMSARLAGYIDRNEAVVDVNNYLTLSDTSSSSSLRLSPHAEREAAGIRGLLRVFLKTRESAFRVAVLDSGLAGTFLPNRTLKYLDYSNGGRLKSRTAQEDPLGHGTRVVSILDRILPQEIALSVGRLPTDPAALTALTIAQALGDIVVREAPDIVNLSVSMRDDWHVCSQCKQRVALPGFLSSLLPLVIRMAGRNTNNTLTVMAAGNSGQRPNSRWLTDDVDSLLFAVAENRRHERTRYSCAPEGLRGDLFSAAAFGGDDPDEPGAQGVFLDGAHGTSFAAPFVSAAALLLKVNQPILNELEPKSIGVQTQRVIEDARRGRLHGY